MEFVADWRSVPTFLALRCRPPDAIASTLLACTPAGYELYYSLTARASKAKAHNLKKLSKGDLEKQLTELKQELSQLRVAKVTGGAATKLSKIKVVRKSIATVLTVMHAEQRAAARKMYAGKKHIPLDLREKKTRAIRRRLSKDEASRVTLRQKKKDQHFSRANHVYAVKA